jgi:hypothetical protein
MPRKPKQVTAHASSKFGADRAGLHKLHSQSAPHTVVRGFEPLPAPTGAAPYRLDLADVVPAAAAAMKQAGGMCLHLISDTGGVLDPTPQELVAAGMVSDAMVAGPYGKPGFCYHLGDVIYFDGEAAQYYPQFYLPYEYYPNPIIAIPGNHDGDRYDRGKLVETTPSLDAFVTNFCAPHAGIHTPEAQDVPRTAMIQPNVFFTLQTPFATFIGLYTNVPEGGVVEQDQRDWFAAELAAAPKSKPIIVGMHHPIHSLDAFHSGSAAMAQVLSEAESASGRKAHLVCAGHVHNFQRFSVTDENGMTPYIVAGFGGYHNLHRMAKNNGQDIVTPFTTPNDPQVVLENFIDDRFGFLRLEIDAKSITISTYTVPRPQESYRTPPRLRDTLVYDWRRRAVIK